MTPWRKILYKELSNLSLTGEVLDLGGSKKSGYHELLKGEHRVTVVNLDKETGADLCFDLEKPFPIKDGEYDAVLCVNILEHIYHYREFLGECRRVLKPGGTLIVAVPFLVQVHPSPHDYFRYTGEALQKMLEEVDFKDISIKPIGSGVGLAAAQLLYNALRIQPLRILVELLGKTFDSTVSLIKKENFLSGKNYPLGYVAISER